METFLSYLARKQTNVMPNHKHKQKVVIKNMDAKLRGEDGNSESHQKQRWRPCNDKYMKRSQ